MTMLSSLHSTTSLSYTTLATTTHNKKYLAPKVLALALDERWKETKGCVERLQAVKLVRKLP
jgi:hypothetical protein